MGLSSKDKAMITPAIAKNKNELNVGIEELSPKQTSLHRAMVARANYLAQDRTDIRFAVKELSRWMSKPRVRDLESLKRLARYLIGANRMCTVYARQENARTLKPGPTRIGQDA